MFSNAVEICYILEGLSSADFLEASFCRISQIPRGRVLVHVSLGVSRFSQVFTCSVCASNLRFPKAPRALPRGRGRAPIFQAAPAPWTAGRQSLRQRRDLGNFRQTVARFRLYRHRFLQENIRFAAFFKIYQIIKLNFFKFGNILQILRHLQRFAAFSQLF